MAATGSNLTRANGAPVRRLIYDVGMHQGEDTAFYLSRGFDVVGIEANPTLVAQIRERFVDHIRSGQLRIVDKAINSTPGRATFAVNRTDSTWGTLSDSFAHRNELWGRPSDYIEVDCVTFEQVLRDYGVPYYLKVDIEGADMMCIDALRQFSLRPHYVSVESSVTSPGASYADAVTELETLRSLGYTAFKFVDQSLIPHLQNVRLEIEGAPTTYSFPEHASGPFGEETPGRWMNFRETRWQALWLRLYYDVLGQGDGFRRTRLAHYLRCVRKKLVGSYTSWYDLHARLDLGGVPR